jgi:hypothetical protein
MILLHCVAFYTPRNEAAGEALTKFQRPKNAEKYRVRYENHAINNKV